MRYTLKYGRFGAYYYDKTEQKELDLMDVLKLLNKEVTNHELSIMSDSIQRIETRIANMGNTLRQNSNNNEIQDIKIRLKNLEATK